MIGFINNSAKNCNGVVPVKEGCYQLLEEEYDWYREKPLATFFEKGGPIDVYKEFSDNYSVLRIGLEFETGNISSAHRSMNKLALGLANNDIDLAVLMMPIHDLSYYLTDLLQISPIILSCSILILLQEYPSYQAKIFFLLLMISIRRKTDLFYKEVPNILFHHLVSNPWIHRAVVFYIQTCFFFHFPYHRL